MGRKLKENDYYLSDKLGLKLKLLREEKGLTVKDLAELSQLSNSYILRIESGDRRNVSVAALYKLGIALGTNLDELLGISTSKPADKLPNLMDVIAENDFQINEVNASFDLKEKLIELLGVIIDGDFDGEFRNQSLFELFESVDEVKRAQKVSEL